LEFNKLGIQKMIEAISDLAMNSILNGNIKLGFKEFIKLTYDTKRLYYLKSAFYWLKVRNKN
jgi:hypothetical protein